MYTRVYLIVHIFDDQQHRAVQLPQVPVQSLQAGSMHHCTVGQLPWITLNPSWESSSQLQGRHGGQCSEGNNVLTTDTVYLFIALHVIKCTCISVEPSQCVYPQITCWVPSEQTIGPLVPHPQKCQNSAASVLHSWWWSEERGWEAPHSIHNHGTVFNTLFRTKKTAHMLLNCKTSSGNRNSPPNFGALGHWRSYQSC